MVNAFTLSHFLNNLAARLLRIKQKKLLINPRPRSDFSFYWFLHVLEQSLILTHWNIWDSCKVYTQKCRTASKRSVIYRKKFKELTENKTIQPIISRMCDQLTNPGHVPLRVGQFARYAKCAKRKVCGVLSNCKFLFESVIRSITKNS